MKFQRKYNKYINYGDTIAVVLPNSNFILLIDPEYLHLIKEYYWRAASRDNCTYAETFTTGKNRKKIRIHNLILPPTDSTFVDHINCNGLDNRAKNLRLCTRSQNSMNTRPRKNTFSKYKGVTYSCCPTKPYRSRIQLDGKMISLGLFYTQKEAAISYNQAALKYFGEFARLNVIEN